MNLVTQLQIVDSNTDPQVMRLLCYSAADAIEERNAVIQDFIELCNAVGIYHRGVLERARELLEENRNA